MSFTYLRSDFLSQRLDPVHLLLLWPLGYINDNSIQDAICTMMRKVNQS